MLDSTDKKIIAALQGDLPLVNRPYKQLADQLGLSEDELIARLLRYRQSGAMRRMGAVLRHREVGYGANALCACRVPEPELERVAAVVSARPEVTHCYSRRTVQDWPYNFYMMLHARTRQEAYALAEDILGSAKVTEHIMLFSTREWKKSSMHYFGEGEEKID